MFTNRLDGITDEAIGVPLTDIAETPEAMEERERDKQILEEKRTFEFKTITLPSHTITKYIKVYLLDNCIKIRIAVNVDDDKLCWGIIIDSNHIDQLAYSEQELILVHNQSKVCLY